MGLVSHLVVEAAPKAPGFVDPVTGNLLSAHYGYFRSACQLECDKAAISLKCLDFLCAPAGLDGRLTSVRVDGLVMGVRASAQKRFSAELRARFKL